MGKDSEINSFTEPTYLGFFAVHSVASVLLYLMIFAAVVFFNNTSLVLKIEIQIQRTEKNSPWHQYEHFHKIFFSFGIPISLKMLSSLLMGKKNTPTDSLEEISTTLCTAPYGPR